MQYPNILLSLKQKRLLAMTGCAVVLGLWSIFMPPLPLEPANLPSDIVMDSHATNDVATMTVTDLRIWEIPVPKSTTPVPVAKPEKIVKKQTVKSDPLPVTRFQPSVPQEGTPQPVRLPQVKYLGEVTDQTGLQVFLSFEDENVMMRMNQVYGQTWQIVAVTDQQVRVLHVPTQQIMNVMK